NLRYDERGNLFEEVCSPQKLPTEMPAQFSQEQLEAVRMLFTIRRRHRYDEQNRRVETSVNMAAQDTDLQTFAYNDYGDVIETIAESSYTDYALGEEGALSAEPDSARSHRSETRFRYQYDPRGNWIEKTAETPGGPIWSIERRTISYFD